ncbi:MAG: hypothetical protein ACRC5M_02890 [Anaeroplasmataceae bacterium]
MHKDNCEIYIVREFNVITRDKYNDFFITGILPKIYNAIMYNDLTIDVDKVNYDPEDFAAKYTENII